MPGSTPSAEFDRTLLAAPRDQISRRFVAAWLGWRGTGKLVPQRAAIELGDIKDLLGRVILFELIGPDEIRIKVAGSQLRDHTDFEATGRNFAELTPPEQWPLRQWRMAQMASRPCGGVMITRDTDVEGDGSTFETVTLPLEPDEPDKPRLLLSNVAVIGGVYDPPRKGRAPLVPLVDEFRFLDLGAGIPQQGGP
jgi:hypothetical protein